MKTFNSLEEAKGQWIDDYTKLLTVPELRDGKYQALAICAGMLCIVEVKLTQISN